MPFLPELIDNIADDNPSIQGIYIDGNEMSPADKITDTDVHFLYQALTFNHHVKSIALPHQLISDVGARLLARYARESLDLSYNTLGSTEFLDLLPPSIQVLKLNGVNWQPEWNPYLVALPNLKILLLDNNHIEDQDFIDLSQLPAVEELSLVNHSLTHQGLIACLSIPSLKVLNLAVTSKALHHTLLTHLPDALMRNKRLETLSLDGWPMTVGVLDALSRHPSLKSVSLKRCKFFDDDLNYFIAPKAIEQLDIRDNPFNAEAFAAFLRKTTLPVVKHSVSPSSKMDPTQRQLFVVHNKLNSAQTSLHTASLFSAYLNQQARGRRRSLPAAVDVNIGKFLMPQTLAMELTHHTEKNKGYLPEVELLVCWHQARRSLLDIGLCSVALSMLYLVCKFNEDTDIPVFITTMIFLGRALETLYRLPRKSRNDVINEIEQDEMINALQNP